jgi:hypothetical protein
LSKATRRKYHLYAGVSFAAILVILSLVVVALISIFFPSENVVLSMFKIMGSSLLIPMMACWFFGLTETGLMQFGGKFFKKDLAYMGLVQCYDSKKFFSFRESSLNKPNSAFIRWFFYSNIGFKGKHISRSFTTHPRFIVKAKIYNDHDDIQEIWEMLKVEKQLMKDLKAKNVDLKFFAAGLPLASYLLLCNKYEDRDDRAILFKLKNETIHRAYMINQLAATAEDIKILESLSLSWLTKATNATNSTY